MNTAPNTFLLFKQIHNIFDWVDKNLKNLKDDWQTFEETVDQ